MPPQPEHNSSARGRAPLRRFANFASRRDLLTFNDQFHVGRTRAVALARLSYNTGIPKSLRPASPLLQATLDSCYPLQRFVQTLPSRMEHWSSVRTNTGSPHVDAKSSHLRRRPFCIWRKLNLGNQGALSCAGDIQSPTSVQHAERRVQASCAFREFFPSFAI